MTDDVKKLPKASEWIKVIDEDDTPAAEKLLERGVDFEAQPFMYGILCLAAGRGRTNIVLMLLAQGADINRKTTGGVTPLMTAAREGRKELVRFLIGKGADVNAVCDLGRTPLIFAASALRTDVMRVLIENMADYKACDNEGNSAQSYAGKIESARMLQLLEEAPAIQREISSAASHAAASRSQTLSSARANSYIVKRRQP